MRRLRSLVIVFTCVVLSYGTGISDAVFSGLSDARFRILTQPASGQLAVIAIDPKAIGKIGVWPWPRRVYGELVGKLQQAEVAEMAFDVDFSSASNPTDDTALAHALENAGGSVMLPVFKQYQVEPDGRRSIHTTFPLPSLSEHAWPVTVNVKPEIDGRIRHYRFGEQIGREFLPSMGALLAGKFLPERGQFAIDFGIDPNSIPQFSVADVLSGRVGKSELSGKSVIIGGTAAELGDRFVVPTYGIIAGPVLQALASESISQNRTLSTTGPVTTLAGLIVLALLCTLVSFLKSLAVRVFVLAALALSIEAAALWIQAHYPVIVDTSLILSALVGYFLFTVIEEIGVYRILATLGQRRFQTIAHSLGDGIICTDQAGTVTFCNPATEDIFGYRAKDLVGMPIIRLFDNTLEGAWRTASDDKRDFNGECHSSARINLELQGIKGDGSNFDAEICLSRWQVDGTVSFGVTIRDVTSRKREQQRIKYLAEHDTLTGLANRSQFNDALAKAASDAEAMGSEFAVLIIDLDDFKIINDTYGHQTGDRLLQEVAIALKTSAAGALVARMGGDEFTIIIAQDDARQAAAELAEEISRVLARTQLVVDGQKVCAQASIGISVYPSDGLEADLLLANADLALYDSKAKQSGSFAFYTSEIRAAMATRLKLEEELQSAFANKEFELYYQPQVDLQSERIVGAEALIRWNHRSGRVVSPAVFMPIVNSSSLSDLVADWVLETAIHQARQWELQGHSVRIGVNISPSQLASGSLHMRVDGLLRDTGLSPHLLELELTEDILIENTEETVATLSRIQAMGVGIAFDDFGTGYASLTYLKRFPLDRLKVDRSFVMNICSDKHNKAIVSSLIALCKGMDLSIIAEGIEDREAVGTLRSLGCDEGQGYYFSRPVPLQEFGQLLSQPMDNHQAAAEERLHPVRLVSAV